MARLIDPWIARTVARRLVGEGSISSSYLMERLRRDLDRAVPLSEELVAEVSGIERPPPVRWEIVDRNAWVANNVASMSAMLAPLAAEIDRRTQNVPAPMRYAQRAAVSAEVGALLGYVSRRVLGQYDLLVPDGEGAAGDRLYFVGANMVETERRFGFVPEEFTLWVAVHEVTHRFQFAGVPWLRPRFLGLVESYLAAVQTDAGTLLRRFAEAVARLVRGQVPPEERNPVYLLSSPEQRAVIDRVQALMAVVEGHGNFVMDYVGRREIPSFGRMRAIFERRRAQTTLAQRAFQHAIGIEMKLRQYELGKEFCDRVVERAGMNALGRLWVSEEEFPTLTELRAPDLWLKRVA